MLRSLVGSEMCIRDRSVVGCVRTSSQAEKMPIDTVIVEDIASFNYWNDCLLYTSDAADEEDSVDLGGRRLIKKKKHTTQTKQSIL